MTMVGQNMVSTGVLVPALGASTGNVNITTGNIVTDEFDYDGVDNDFELTYPAALILNIFIENGVHREYVPAGPGPFNNVVIEQEVLLEDNKIYIQYIRA